jgi:hypothetical protein
MFGKPLLIPDNTSTLTDNEVGVDYVFLAEHMILVTFVDMVKQVTVLPITKNTFPRP